MRRPTLAPPGLMASKLFHLPRRPLRAERRRAGNMVRVCRPDWLRRALRARRYARTIKGTYPWRDVIRSTAEGTA
jgi:hypothetical protein